MNSQSSPYRKGKRRNSGNIASRGVQQQQGPTLSEELKSTDWTKVLSSLNKAWISTSLYWTVFYSFMGGTSYSNETSFGEDVWAKVNVYSLALIFKLWSKEHYRSPSFQTDMINNLQNVAIPGTGIPLSYFCYNWHVCLFFVVILNPIICFFGAINKARHGAVSIETFIVIALENYIKFLLHPDDWFSFWRLNCRLASYHSLVTQSTHYRHEDKWTFLIEGKSNLVPITPFFDVPSIVLKNKNVEGGLGIHFYNNAVHGGDWIIQEKLTNSDWLNKLLPPNPPLSTMRVITASTLGMTEKGRSFLSVSEVNKEISTEDIAITETWKDSNKVIVEEIKFDAGLGIFSDRSDPNQNKPIRALSGVLRLGRAGAATDHSSILFDVDLATGLIKEGNSNAHWYKLGVRNVFDCPWLPQATCEIHPDAPHPQVSGKIIPNIHEVLKICVDSHTKMMPEVPLVGWDVAFTDKGIKLLEVNLSCNFFRGSFDHNAYIKFVDAYWRDLTVIEEEKMYNTLREERLKELKEKLLKTTEIPSTSSSTRRRRKV